VTAPVTFDQLKDDAFYLLAVLEAKKMTQDPSYRDLADFVQQLEDYERVRLVPDGKNFAKALLARLGDLVKVLSPLKGNDTCARSVSFLEEDLHFLSNDLRGSVSSASSPN
jgi:hypothetical protein